MLTRSLKMPAACALGIFSGIIILNYIPGKSADFPGMPFHTKGTAQFPLAPRMASSTVEAALYSEPAACSTCSCVGRLTAGVSVLPPSAGVVSGWGVSVAAGCSAGVSAGCSVGCSAGCSAGCSGTLYAGSSTITLSAGVSGTETAASGSVVGVYTSVFSGDGA